MPVYKRVSCPHCSKCKDLRNEDDKLKKDVCVSCRNQYNITDRNSDWYVDYCYGGRRFREKVGKSKTLAETVLAKIKIEIVEGKYLDKKHKQKIRFSDFADEYLEKHSKVNNRSWHTTDVHSIKTLKKFLADKTLCEITSHDVVRFKAERAKEISEASVNRELACLKSIYNKAILWGKFDGINPVNSVKLFKENNKRLRYLETDEIQRLILNCTGNLKAIVVIAINTGMRRGEILSLRWNQIDLIRGIIYLHNTKNGDSREIPINESVKIVLQRQPRHSISPYVFYKNDGSMINDVKKSFFTALTKSGIKDFRFHDLRHTFASHLAMKGVDLNVIRVVLGHKSMAMTIRYSHLSQQHIHKAVALLDSQIDTGLTQNSKELVSV